MTAMDVIASLDEIRAAINVLEHPFYERWSAGELTAGELSCYAGEYRLAVRALAEASRLAADKSGPAQLATLRAHAREEADHVELWEQFASAAGAGPASGADGDGELAQTRACASAWTAGEHVLDHLAVLYAIEASQPQVSETKLEGLCAHYG
jgi:pyrroloquinoline-quinone synthase